MTLLQWDFSKLSTVKMQTNTYQIHEDFNNIAVETDVASVVFALSADGKCVVECYEEEKAKHTVVVEDRTLTVKVADNKAWYDHIGINFSLPKVTVYLPKEEYVALCMKVNTGNVQLPQEFKFSSIEIAESTGTVNCSASASGAVKIKTSTGNLCVANMSAGSLDLAVTTGELAVSNVVCQGDANIQVTTGDASLTQMTCKKLTSEGSTGDILLTNVIAEEKLSVTRSTGNVTFESADAGEIFTETSTGEVKGTLLSEKSFFVQSNTGKVSVPQTTGGKCEIHTNTGNVKITLK